MNLRYVDCNILFLRCCEMLVVYEVNDESDITFIF